MNPEEQTQEEKIANRERFRKRMESKGRLGVPFIPGDTYDSYAARCYNEKYHNGNK